MNNTDHAPLLVIGIGNPLMADDGIGVHLLELLKDSTDFPQDQVEFLDGGTQGMALIGRLTDRKAVVFLDAVSMNSQPGDIHVLDKQQLLSFNSKTSSAHEGSASDIIRTAMLTDDVPEIVLCIGIEPKILKTSIGFSEEIKQAVITALDRTKEEISAIIESLD